MFIKPDIPLRIHKRPCSFLPFRITHGGVNAVKIGNCTLWLFLFVIQAAEAERRIIIINAFTDMVFTTFFVFS